jgi:hypothetical protein
MCQSHPMARPPRGPDTHSIHRERSPLPPDGPCCQAPGPPPPDVFEYCDGITLPGLEGETGRRSRRGACEGTPLRGRVACETASLAKLHTSFTLSLASSMDYSIDASTCYVHRACSSSNDFLNTRSNPRWCSFVLKKRDGYDRFLTYRHRSFRQIP